MAGAPSTPSTPVHRHRRRRPRHGAGTTRPRAACRPGSCRTSTV